MAKRLGSTSKNEQNAFAHFAVKMSEDVNVNVIVINSAMWMSELYKISMSYSNILLSIVWCVVGVIQYITIYQ